MADWTPLDEGDQMPGDPNGIADLLRRLRAEAQRIGAVAGRLRAVNAGDFWTGDSATEFASRVGRAAPDLDLAATRIETTVTALNRYLQAIGDCQSRGRTASSGPGMPTPTSPVPRPVSRRRPNRRPETRRPPASVSRRTPA